MSWNDSRSRYDHEVGVGGTMQRFFADVSQAMAVSGGGPVVGDDSSSATGSASGDNQLNDPFGKIDLFEDDLDGRIREHIKISFEDPADFLTQPGNTLRDWTLKLLRARRHVQSLMTTSGEHGDDIYNFCETALRRCKLSSLLGVFPLYYFCLKASKVSDFDKEFQPFMDETLKGDSATNSVASSLRASIGSSSEKKIRAEAKIDELVSVVRQIVDNDGSSSAKQQADAELVKQKMRIEKMRELNMLQSQIREMESITSDADSIDPFIEKVKKRKNDLLQDLFG